MTIFGSGKAGMLANTFDKLEIFKRIYCGIMQVSGDVTSIIYCVYVSQYDHQSKDYARRKSCVAVY